MAAARRQRVVDELEGLNKPSLVRLARRGGVKRIEGTVYENVRRKVDRYMGDVIRDALLYAQHARRTTVTTMDMVHALQRRGRPIYGFGA